MHKEIWSPQLWYLPSYSDLWKLDLWVTHAHLLELFTLFEIEALATNLLYLALSGQILIFLMKKSPYFYNISTLYSCRIPTLLANATPWYNALCMCQIILLMSSLVFNILTNSCISWNFSRSQTVPVMSLSVMGKNHRVSVQFQFFQNSPWTFPFCIFSAKNTYLILLDYR